MQFILLLLKQIKNSKMLSSSILVNLTKNWLTQNHVIDILISFICIIGSSMQVFDQTIKYFSWDVTYETIFSDPNVIEIPTFRFCTDIVNAVDLIKLYTDHPTMFNQLCTNLHKNETSFRLCIGAKMDWKYLADNLVNRLTLDQLHNYMINPKKIMKKIYLPNISEDALADNKCHLEGHIMDPKACITLTCLNESGQPYLIDRSKLTDHYHIGMMITIELINNLFNFNDHFTISLYKSGTIPFGLEAKTLSFYFTPNIRTIYAFNFKIVISKLLPSPYKTMCRNNQQNAELERCLNQQSIEKLNTPYPETWIDPKRYINSPLRFRIVQNMSEQTETELKKIYLNCQANIGVDCYKENYLPNYIRTNSPKRIQNSSFINIFSPFEHTTILTAQPKLSFPEYIIYLGSILSLWWGFNIISQSDNLKQFLSYVKTHRMNSRNSDNHRDHHSFNIFRFHYRPKNLRRQSINNAFVVVRPVVFTLK